MVQPPTRYSQTRKRLNPWVIALIALIHVALFYLLARALEKNGLSEYDLTLQNASDADIGPARVGGTQHKGATVGWRGRDRRAAPDAARDTTRLGCDSSLAVSAEVTRRLTVGSGEGRRRRVG